MNCNLICYRNRCLRSCSCLIDRDGFIVFGISICRRLCVYILFHPRWNESCSCHGCISVSAHVCGCFLCCYCWNVASMKKLILQFSYKIRHSTILSFQIIKCCNSRQISRLADCLKCSEELMKEEEFNSTK